MSLLYCLPQPSHFGRLGPPCRPWTFVSCLRRSRRSICLPHMTHFSCIGPPCRPWVSRSCLRRLEVEGPVSLNFRPQFGCEHTTSKGEHISSRGNVCIPLGSLPFRVLGTGASKSTWQLPDFRSAAEPFSRLQLSRICTRTSNVCMSTSGCSRTRLCNTCWSIRSTYYRQRASVVSTVVKDGRGKSCPPLPGFGCKAGASPSAQIAAISRAADLSCTCRLEHPPLYLLGRSISVTEPVTCSHL